jgi:hypothetical protein
VASPVLVLALVAMLVQAGCASVEHVRLYREARADFGQAAEQDNLTTLNHLFPAAASVEAARQSAPPSPSARPFDVEGARKSYERWHHVHRELGALLSRAERELRADHLYGAARALEIRARARRDFYAHVLGVGGAAPGAGPIPPLTVSVQEADAVLAQRDVELFPRDEYLLRSLRPTIRYEIAYLNALRLMERRQPVALPAIDGIVGQMAQAEEELAAAAPRYPAQVLPHATMSRFAMLVSAEFLVQDTANQQLPIPPEDARLADLPGLRHLGERIARFRACVQTAGTAESGLFTALGLDPRPQNLTTWGLGEVTGAARALIPCR